MQRSGNSSHHSHADAVARLDTVPCPQAYDICYMMADECEELIEHLLVTEDVLKAAEVGEQVETEQERPEDFASSSE